MKRTPKPSGRTPEGTIEAGSLKEAVEIMEQRRYVRHPSDVPINVHSLASQAPPSATKPLKDIGFGGLSFHSQVEASLGDMLLISIPVVEPVFEIEGRVVWCTEAGLAFDIGVEFTEPDKVYKARMVEQVCHIEHYRIEIRQSEGRELSGGEAAAEWIEKYAADFPEL